MDNISDRDRLIQYLRQKAEQQNTEAADLEAVQQDIANKQAMVGMLEGGSTITNAAFGVKNDPNAYATAKAANQQMLTDYLNKKKAERNLEYDKFQAVKELSDLEQAKERAKLEEQRMKQQAQMNAQAMKEKNDYRDEMLDLREREKVAKIAGALEKEGVNDAETVLREVDGLLKQYPSGDIPGFGRIESSVPGAMSPTEWNNNRIIIESLASQIRKAKYGSAQSKQESENFLKEFGSGNVSADTLRKGLKLQRDIIENKKRNVFQGDPKAAEAYLANQPKAQSMVGPEGSTPSTSSVEKVTVTKDGKSYKLPKSQLDSALKQGYTLAQ
jgi:hypothetical protein